ALAPGLRVGALAGVATAAVREAADGPAFRDRIEDETGIRLKIATGEDEARLAAQGVLFGNPNAEGLVIDLGGASMELCPIHRRRPGRGTSAPLGPLRLDHLKNQKRIRQVIDETLSPVAETFQKSRDHLHLVGGAWRAFGRVQITRSGHPMNVLHEYRFAPEDGLKTAALIIDGDRETLLRHGAPGGRVDNMPLAAMIFEALIRHFAPEDITISGFGLREGVCYDYLPTALKRQDPLLSTCLGQEKTRARAPGFGKELAAWILPAFPAEDAAEERLIRAACHLVDVSWRAHPDYRAVSCIEVVTRVNVSSAGHRGRAFIAAALLGRYKGGRRALAEQPELTLLTEARLKRAQQLGALMRLGATLSGAVTGQLPHASIAVDQNTLTLTLHPRHSGLWGEEVQRRLSQAAKALDCDWAVTTG
ncbi:MAG: exopolyphosphatase, partial [Pseudomonadota bacterium]